MQQRAGHLARILDGERFTIVFASSYLADGSHRRPVIDVVDRRHPNDSPRGYAPKRIARIPFLHVRFMRCYRLRRVGGLRWYRLWHRGVRRLVESPERRERRAAMIPRAS
jgi:hypothetical protein